MAQAAIAGSPADAAVMATGHIDEEERTAVMSKKYLSLDEAAAQLRIAKEDLTRLREKGEVRGFADRGTWKFKVEDIDNLARTRQVDSDPNVPLLNDRVVDSDDDAGDQPTIIRKGQARPDSDSDVQLVTDEPPAAGGSSKELSLGDSDSDVRLVGSFADSSPSLVPDDEGSDSDVKLLPDTIGQGSDSDVQLVAPGKGDADEGSDSDVALMGSSDSSIALDFTTDDSDSASVLSDESGIALAGDSGIALSHESGISLAGPSDSGIALDIAPDEGITLASGDSGIALEAAGDSGIALGNKDKFAGTVPMMDVMESDDGLPETHFEIPSLSDDRDDSQFELKSSDSSGDETTVLNLEESGDSSLSDAVFDLDEGADASADELETVDESVDDLEVSSEVLGEDDELDELDVFDAGDETFEESGSSQDFAAPISGRGAVAVEAEWGAGTFVGLLFSTVLLVLVGVMMFDLVGTMWDWHEPNTVASMLLDSLGGLYK